MSNYQTRKDFLLLSYFRNNARENLTTISRQTNIPVSTIFDKLHQFEESLIKKHTSLFDFKQIGFDVKVNILFKTARENRDAFKDFLMGNFHINSIYRVNNGFDFLIEAIFKDMGELHDFLEEVEAFKIESKQELFILEDLKREGFLSDAVHAEIIYNSR